MTGSSIDYRLSRYGRTLVHHVEQVVEGPESALSGATGRRRVALLLDVIFARAGHNHAWPGIDFILKLTRIEH